MRLRALLVCLGVLDWLVQVIPRSAAGPLVRLAGRYWFVAAPAARTAVRANLRRVLGHEPPRSLVRAVFEHGALVYWDTFLTPHLSADQIARMVEIVGLEHIDHALASGRGVLIASGHLASVSMVGQVLAARGYAVASVTEPIEPPELLDFFVAHRKAFGTRMLPAGRSSIRALLAILRRNEILGLVSDRDVLGTGERTMFFGQPARFPTGLAVLALRTGAPILTGFANRRADGSFLATFEPPFRVDITGDQRRDVTLLINEFVRRLEYHVGRHPEQWTVFQERWPDSSASTD